jgi:hypothetical protein
MVGREKPAHGGGVKSCFILRCTEQETRDVKHRGNEKPCCCRLLRKNRREKKRVIYSQFSNVGSPHSRLASGVGFFFFSTSHVYRRGAFRRPKSATVSVFPSRNAQDATKGFFIKSWSLSFSSNMQQPSKSFRPPFMVRSATSFPHAHRRPHFAVFRQHLLK